MNTSAKGTACQRTSVGTKGRAPCKAGRHNPGFARSILAGPGESAGWNSSKPGKQDGSMGMGKAASLRGRQIQVPLVRDFEKVTTSLTPFPPSENAGIKPTSQGTEGK